ncbi:MAG: hypothetical protein NVS2B16_03450 [Chloroflexota bacterium]
MYNLDHNSMAATRKAEWEREVRTMQLSKQATAEQTTVVESSPRIHWAARAASQIRHARQTLFGVHAHSI